MGRFEDVQQAVMDVADNLVERKETYLEGAIEEFIALVDPAACHSAQPTLEQITTVNLCFSEWVMFERPLGDDKTPIRLGYERARREETPRKAAILHAIDETQFFSRFAICGKDGERGMASLRDVRTGEAYEVFDTEVCAQRCWASGTIALRIACVDGVWQTVGQVRLYDRAPAPAGVVDDSCGVCIGIGPNGMDVWSESYYLHLLRDVIGADGRFLETLRVREPAT